MPDLNKDVDKQSFWKKLPCCEALPPSAYCFLSGKLLKSNCSSTPVCQFSYAAGNHWHSHHETLNHRSCFSQWVWPKLQMPSGWVFTTIRVTLVTIFAAVHTNHTGRNVWQGMNEGKQDFLQVRVWLASGILQTFNLIHALLLPKSWAMAGTMVSPFFWGWY